MAETVGEILQLDVSDFNILVAFLGAFLSVFGLVSYLFKEKFYLSEALISMLIGVAFSPHAANLIRPMEYAQNSEENLHTITLYFTRLVLGIQLVLAGIQLPSRYLKLEWKSLTWLLGPVMCSMWIATSLLVYAMVPNLPFLHALAVGSCVTPTDPVLSNSIVKGKFADKNIPKELQKIIIAESGANDGLGYPFLYLALYLIKYTAEGGAGTTGGAAKAMGYWFGVTWGYTIILSVLYGTLIGWAFRKALRFAEDRHYVDRESFLVFAISIALFISGTAGMVGSDDVLACFVAGNVFTWDDWFRLETMDDSFQPTIDMLLNVSIFAWYGAICPWRDFAYNSVIPVYRLVFLGILVLLLRRLPVVLALHKYIPQIEHWRQALFVGFFGPIGVSAIFYLYISLEFLKRITYEGDQRQDADRLSEVMTVVVWFMAVSSIVVHGLSIPMGKLGFHLPRTISQAVSYERSADSPPFTIHKRGISGDRALEAGHRKTRSLSRGRSGQSTPDARRLFRIGGKTMPASNSNVDMGPFGDGSDPGTPVDKGKAKSSRSQETGSGEDGSGGGGGGTPTVQDLHRSIQFSEAEPDQKRPRPREITFSESSNNNNNDDDDDAADDESRDTGHGRGTMRFPQDYMPMSTEPSVEYSHTSMGA